MTLHFSNIILIYLISWLLTPILDMNIIIPITISIIITIISYWTRNMYTHHFELFEFFGLF